MKFHQHVLPNGLTLVGETSDKARSVSLGFFVRTGARDETAEVSGVSHFLEHMVFKGTPRRSAFDVNRDFDKIGANYNAFTSEENTVFYAAILPEYLPQAVDILADILRPSLRQEDFDVEKKVIIEEIGMYDDQPSWSAYDLARKQFYVDHPLGHSVLGTAQSVGDLKCDQMRAYFERRYVAPNITVSAAGNFDWNHFVDLVEKACGVWPTGTKIRDQIREAPPRKSLRVVQREKTAQEHLVLITPAPAANSLQRHAADTLAMILGDDSGSRLYWALVDPGYVDSADLSFHDYEGAGAFFASISCDPETTTGNLEILDQVLKQVTKEGVTAEELSQAKNKIQSRLVRSSERPMGRMQALGMAWTYLGQYRSVDDELRDFSKVTLEDIRGVLDRYPLDQLSTLALGPLKELPASE